MKLFYGKGQCVYLLLLFFTLNLFSQPFVELTGISLQGNNSVWGDYDNDGDLDILSSGYYGLNRSKIFRNNGEGNFSEETGILLDYMAVVSWCDYDNDGNLDMLLTGRPYIYDYPMSKIYHNNGNNTFTEQTGISLIAVHSGSIDWGDFDNDGDQDILLSGATRRDYPYNPVSKIFINNGDNTFSEHTGVSLPGVYNSCSVDWGDYDNDGDLDILLTGNAVSKIFRNDNGAFLDINCGITGVSSSSSEWGDYDNDGDLDVLLTGYTNLSYISKIYRNDNGVFTDIGAGLTGVSGGASEWGDFDNDGDLDIVLTGSTGSTSISIIYRNDSGIFTDIGAGLTGVSGYSSEWGDYDNDGDLDLLIGSKIYRNDCSVHNSLPSVPDNLQVNGPILSWDVSTDAETPFGSITYNLRIGSSPGANDIYTSMSNTDGKRQVPEPGNLKNNLSFIPQITTNGTYYWSVQAVDNQMGASAWAAEQVLVLIDYPEVTLNTDTLTTSSFNIPVDIEFNRNIIDFDQSDIIITNGVINDFQTLTSDKKFRIILNPASAGGISVYIKINTVTGDNGNKNLQSNNLVILFKPFTDIINNINGVQCSSAAWGDYDNDGDLDILLTGTYNYTQSLSIIYHNDSSVFTDIGAGLTGVGDGSAAWGDYDNDGDLDILLTGSTGIANTSAIIYRNDNGIFSDIGAGLPGIRLSSAVWGDYDNDGDLDILLTGTNSTYQRVSDIYQNNSGVFTNINAGITGVSYSSAVFGDYDNDGDLDILLTGNYDATGISSSDTSMIYRNENGVFTDINAGLKGVKNSSASWGDFDNDGDLDILITGITGVSPNYTFFTCIYRNDNCVFNDIDAGLTGVYDGTSAWGDYDNDGDLDILLTGRKSSAFISKICRNNNGIFTEFDAGLSGINSPGSSAWADYDNDGDLDILLTGMYSASGTSTAYSKLFQNNIVPRNVIPNPPSNLNAHMEGNKIVLTWIGATDTETPKSGLTYNIRIGKTPGGTEILSPMSLSGGKRKIVSMGNALTGTSAWINISNHLPLEKVFFSIQSIDNNLAGSSWTTEQELEINALRADFSSSTICRDDTTKFTDISVAGNNLVIDKWEWDFGDGTSAIVTNPSRKNVMHIYPAGGTYNASLTIHSGSITHSVSKKVVVKFRPNPSFTAPPVCIGSNTLFTNTSELYMETVAEWFWDFDDGFVSRLQDPGLHGFTQSGTYDVMLRITTDRGCVGEIIEPVIVAEYPNAFASLQGSSEFCEGGSATLLTIQNPNYLYQWYNGPNPVTNGDSYLLSVSFTGTYAVEITNPAANCKSISNSLIIVSNLAPPQPVITSYNYKPGKCLGESTLRLNINEVDPECKYQWYRNSIPIAGANLIYLEGFLTSGDYTVIAERSGCKTQSEVFNVYFTNAPEKPVIYAKGPQVWYLVCSNDSASGYKWYCNGNLIEGANNYYFVANRKMGNYQVLIINNEGCYTMSDIVTIPTGTTGIDDMDLFEGLKIYPNPTTGTLTIEIENNIFGKLMISIITGNGKEIRNIRTEKTVEHFLYEIDLSDQAKGPYIISLLIEKYFTVRKVILE